MTRVVEVFIPCELFSVQIVSAPAATLSELERLILTAVHRGVDSIAALESLFGLGERPLLDLVFDLWQSGDLTVFPETGKMVVSEEIGRAVATNTLGSFRSSERHETAIELLYDLVSGSVMQRQPGARTVSREHCAPALLKEGSYRGRIRGRGRAELIRVVSSIWSATTQSGRKLRILAANLALPLKTTATHQGEVRQVLVEVACDRDPVSRQLKVTVLSPASLPLRARSSIEAALAGLVEDKPLSPFSKLLLRSAEDAAEGIRSAGSQELVAGLQALVDRLETSNAGTLPDWHEKLLAQAESCAEAIRAEMDSQSDIVPIVRLDEQQRVIQELIGAARRQVVLSCPFLNYEAFQPYRDAIAAALKGGARVFLIWGMEDPALSSGLVSMFEWFRSQSPSFYVSEAPARCHAKFVICDASSLLVTSYNFLNRQAEGGAFELALRIRARRQGEPCQAALDLLKRSSEIFPDYHAAALISADGEDLGSSAAPDEGGEETLPGQPLAEIAADTNYARTALQLWRGEWRACAQRFAAALADVEYPCKVVLDGRHRELLHQALRGASTLVVIMSDRLTADVVNQPFLDELAECLRRGTLVAIVYQRPEIAALQELRAVQGAHAEALELLSDTGVHGGDEQGRASHAKVLIADDQATVTSFNFLSFEGYYAGADKHRVRSEAGVTVRSWPLAVRLLHTLSGEFPALARIAVRAEARAAAVATAAVTPAPAGWPRRSLQELLIALLRSAPDPPAQGRTLVSWFRDAGSDAAAAAELEALRDAGLPDLRRAAAACLTARGSTTGEPGLDCWYTWIAESVWHDARDPHATLLLQAALSGPPASAALPPLPLLELLILTLTKPFPQTLFESLLPAAGERDAAAALAGIGLPALLLEGVPLAESLDLLRPGLDPGWSAWTSAALAYWQELGEPVPLDDLRQGLGARDAREETARLRDELLQELARTVHLSLPFKLGQLVWPRLVNGDGGYRALIRIVEKGDVAAALAWLEQHGAELPAIEARLDEIAKTVAAEHSLRTREITSKKRKLCVTRMHSVATRTAAWIRTCRGDTGPATVRPAVGELARAFARAGVQVREETGALRARRSFASPIVETAMARLDLLVAYGGAP
jgi:phosphatidylserine/phosphatidylglycerophosphate/cardiolipin synthase-like enzyme